MKSHISLWSCAANELAARCSTSTIRDIKTVSDRVEHEGLAFLAITLADLGKATQKWLDQGFVVPRDCPAFKTGPSRRLPAFLRGFYERVFNPCSGVLLEYPDTEAISALQQLLLMFSKIALPGESLLGGPSRAVSPRRERRAMSEYLQCEKEVKRSDSLLDPDYLGDFKRVSRLLFGDVFALCDRDVHWGRIYPKHGPGATADGLSSNGKYRSQLWTTRLQRVFPAEEYLVPNGRFASPDGRDSHLLEPDAEIPVRVITVPKTLKSPRIIAIEPTAMQYVQQGLLRSLLNAIREDSFLSRVIGFNDQIPNQEMARLGSLSGELATLDLSEASDRVSNQHVRAMLEDYPELLWAVDACRSRKADVPGHGVIRLAKFASMGSALCFPFEAMVFLTVCLLGIERELSSPLTPKVIHSLREQVRVYGDDIIVPCDYVLSVVSELELFGFRVNTSKSFWTGRFRESCGKEYYDGQDVSIVKVREVLPTRRQDASGIIAASSLRNRLYWAGLWQTARWMDGYLGDLLKVYPNVAPSSPLLGRESVLGYETQRLHPTLHSPLTKGYYVKSRSPIDKLDGVGALLKCLLPGHTVNERLLPRVDNGGLAISDANVDKEHLERSGRPEHVSIKLGWKSPF